MFGLHPELCNPLLAALAVLQDVINLLHQGHTIDEAEVDQTSHHEWGSMASSLQLEAL